MVNFMLFLRVTAFIWKDDEDDGLHLSHSSTTCFLIVCESSSMLSAACYSTGHSVTSFISKVHK